VAILLALMSSAVWGTSDFIGGVVSRRVPAYRVVAASQTAGFCAVTVAVLASTAFGVDHGWVLPAVLAGATGAGGLVMFYTALAVGTMGIVAPIAALGALVPVAVGLARGESPSAVTSVGVVLALAGAVFASGPELRERTGSRPVLLAGLSAVSFGLCMTFLADGAQHSPLLSLWGMRATSVTGMTCAVLVLRRRRTGGRALRRTDIPLLITAGIGDSGANLLFSVATLHGYISVVSVLASLYPVMTVLLARTVLNQRLLGTQVLGVSGALLGIALVAVG
jgi:drug/metabolite transporter (DMT)-like permease